MSMIVPFPEDVLPLFTEDENTRPLSKGDLSYRIATGHGIPLRNSHDANKAVSKLKLGVLLDDWVADGTLIKHTGREWEERGITFYDMRGRVPYYTTPAVAAQLDTLAEQAADTRRHTQARKQALTLLAEKFPEDYGQLTAQVKAELDQQAKNAPATVTGELGS